MTRPNRDQPALWQIRWSWVAGPDAAKDFKVVGDCSDLFSRHYGTWGAAGPAPAST